MNLIVLGPQGSGKGTQAELLGEKLGLVHVEMGRILRSIAASNNPLAEKIRSTQESGGLVDDETVRLIAWDFINKHQNGGFVFEGYPRGVSQYEMLKEMLKRFGKKIDKVILLDIPETESIKRLSGRRTCSKCGEVFNLASKPPIQAGVCDECGGKLMVRSDDQPESISRRLELYKQQTAPIFELALQDGIGIKVDGTKSIEEIHKQIMVELGHA
jgi:adenylate kinase